MNPNKATKEKLMGTQKKDKTQKEKFSKDRRDRSSRNTKLQLKGRIFMTNVTEIHPVAKPGLSPITFFRLF